ncbi:T9SS type A sorting domain-containing protein [Dyadobacter sp. 676]|uniref:T9SS type A sorting domain-containing protein n=1 Tax=Dyadobacter sp. 676 TaxID=3088362 RepID=A0AAU8FFZ1_9BACT
MQRFILSTLLSVSLLMLAAIQSFAQNCTVNAGADKSICTTTVSLSDANRNGVFSEDPTWTVVSAPAGGTAAFSNANSLTPTVNMNGNGTFVFRITQACGNGVVSDDVAVTTYFAPFFPSIQPVSACGSSSTLNVTGPLPSGFTGQWSGPSEVIITPTGPNTANVTLADPTAYRCGRQTSLTWTVTSPNGCTRTAFANVSWLPSAADIELQTTLSVPDCQSVAFIPYVDGSCFYGSGTTETISNVVYPAGYSGPGLRAGFNGGKLIAGFTTAGTYTFRFTIDVGSCGSKSFDMTVTKTGGTAPVGGVTVSGGEPIICLNSDPATITSAFTLSDPTLLMNSNWSNWIMLPSGSGTPTISISGAGTSTRPITINRPAGGWKAGQYLVRLGYANADDVNGTCKGEVDFRFFMMPATWTNFDVPDVTICTQPGSPIASYAYPINTVPNVLAGLGPLTMSPGNWNIRGIGADSGIFRNPSADLPLINFSNLSVGVHTFRIVPASITNSLLYRMYQCAGSNFSDTFSITVVANSGATAGTDNTVSCIDNQSLAGNVYAAPMVGTWSVVSSPPGNYTLGFSDIHDPSAVVTGTGGAPAGSYTFRWTVQGPAGSECGVYTDDVTITATGGCVFPVTLASFSAVREGNTAQLSWVTTEEVNAGYFEVQRSPDGKAWSEIGKVKADGNSTVLHKYEYIDPAPLKGTNYYRLKMVDLDQTFAYSSIQSVAFEGRTLSVYPNPVSDVLTLTDLDPGSFSAVLLLDINGNIVYESSSVPVAGIDVKKYLPGTYVVQIRNTDGTGSSAKVVIAP